MLSCVAAGNAFVQLFLQSKTRYELSNRKLQYLLCIAQMTRLNCGKVLFNEDIKNQKYEFTIDCIADNFVYNRNIVDGTVKNAVLDIPEDNLTLPYETRRIYEIKEPLSDEDKALIISVFINFGGFNEILLRDKLNEFLPLRNLSLFNEIPKETITDFFVSSFENEAFNSNEVFTFVKGIYIEENSATEVIPEEEPAVEFIEEEKSIPEAISVEYLKDISSIDNVSVRKEYSVLVEFLDDTCINDILVLSIRDNSPVNGTFKKITDRLYSFTFVGVPSDIKISVKC